jgi:predicted HAD superfamily Cof-like phosphohydrolase
MFLQHLNEASHMGVAEFIKVMGANRDFYFWATTLVPEETKELKAELEAEQVDMAKVLKELADLNYVLIGMYQTMPANPQFLLSEDMNQEVENALTEAYKAAADAINGHMVPIQLLDKAIAVVHESNMSKLGEDGKPIRREDGKVMKGPNYKAPDMVPLAEELKQFVADLPKNTAKAAGMVGNETSH